MNFGLVWASGYATTLRSGPSGSMLRCRPSCSLGRTTTISRSTSDWDRHSDASIHKDFSLGAWRTGAADAVLGRRAVDAGQHGVGPRRHRTACLSTDPRPSYRFWTERF